MFSISVRFIELFLINDIFIAYKIHIDIPFFCLSDLNKNICIDNYIEKDIDLIYFLL